MNGVLVAEMHTYHFGFRELESVLIRLWLYAIYTALKLTFDSNYTTERSFPNKRFSDTAPDNRHRHKKSYCVCWSQCLEKTLQFAINRGYISHVTRSNLSSSGQSVQHDVGDSDADESELKRWRMKMELLEERRNEAQLGHNVTNEVGPTFEIDSLV